MELGASIQVYTFGRDHVTEIISLGHYLYVVRRSQSSETHYKAKNCLLDFYNCQCERFHPIISLSQFKHAPGNRSIHRAVVR